MSPRVDACSKQAFATGARYPRLWARANVRRIVGISIYGSPKLYVKFVNDNGRRTLMRAMRLNTGARTRTAWLGLYAIDTATDATTMFSTNAAGRITSGATANRAITAR